MAASPTTSISFQNFFSATLTSDITASSTDIPIDNVPNGSEGFLVIEPDSTTAHEVIYYTSKTATKVVCPSVADGRGQDDTSAAAHSSGATVIMAPIAAYFETLLALFTTTPQGWTALSGTFTSPTYLGQRSYQFTTSVDQTAILSRGMRLRTSRTATAPVQCTSLNGSSQYYNKTSPAGTTFTDDFVVSSWVKLSSYATAGIISRYNGTSGWYLVMNADGTLSLYGHNAGAGNYSQISSYQALPLNKWVHITGQLDMSAFTATTTTSYFMLDGVDIPSVVSRAGTNPTALVQAGNLEIGSRNGGSNPFPGKIAQAAYFSAKVTQATMRTYISQGLAGTETSLVSAYSFNNSINDLNGSNANNLTAQGSAVATNSDSPFTVNDKGTPGGTYDYAIITDVTASTVTCQVAEGCAIPTSGGISAASYSTYKAPFGMPVDLGKWTILAKYNTRTTKTSPVSTTAYNLGEAITAPIGQWIAGYEALLYEATSTAGFHNPIADLNTASATTAGTSSFASGFYANSNLDAGGPVNARSDLSVAAQTVYYLNVKPAFNGTTTSVNFLHDVASGQIYLELAYL